LRTIGPPCGQGKPQAAVRAAIRRHAVEYRRLPRLAAAL